MTRDGLVEQNLATGEENHVSQRGQDFELHQKASESQLQPMEAAQPSLRSHQARSHEAPAGENSTAKKATYRHQSDTVVAEKQPLYETTSDNKSSAYSAEKPQYKHQYDTANHPNAPYSSDTSKTRLKFSEPQQELPKKQAKQHGTKYQQQFTDDVTKSELVGNNPVDSQSPSSRRFQFGADELPVDSKAAKLQEKSEKITSKLNKAHSKLPAKKRLKKQMVYDEQKGKAKTKLYFEEEVKPQGGKKPSLPVRTGKSISRAVTRVGINKVHQKIGEVEHENVGVKAFHKTEQTAENAYRGGKSVRSAYRFVKDTPYRRVAKLEKQAAKANLKLDYQKVLKDNPKLNSNLFSRMMQKRKIKQQYAKTARKAQKVAGKAAKKTGEKAVDALKAAVTAIKNHPGIAVTLGAIALVVVIIMTSVSACSNIAMGSIGAVFGTSYLSNDRDIDSAELAYTEWETDLQMQINSAESTYPDYDEYRYNVGDIGHDPYELMAYLTARYQEFTFAAVQGDLQAIFAEQYQLTFLPEIEVRYRTETRTDSDGNDYDVEVPYNWYVMNVSLTTRSFTDIVTPRLSGNEPQIYDLLMESKGNRQYAYSPFEFNWVPYISDYYGWRVHPISGEKDYHKAIDIAVAEGTQIIAAHDGTVVTATYDSDYGYYVAIDDGKGLVTKYAHCSQLFVSPGQQVLKGDPIAKVGNTGTSTGAHLHFEVMKDGQYLNPLFFAVTGDDGSGRIPPGMPGGTEFPEYPGEPLGDGSYSALITEAEKHLGKPYVFGANGPNSFDCSSFVCWTFTNSGVYNLPRTTAWGIYQQCTPVSPEEARPGDLIFFTGTYSTTSPTSHIGIYVGNGMMIHAGNPIQYTSINSSYWQSHFYSFGRLPE